MSKSLTPTPTELDTGLDLLADVLADSHQGLVYARRFFPDGWALRFDGETYFGFYIVRRGELTIRLPNDRTHRLRRGDVALLAGPHEIATDPDVSPLPFSPEMVQSLTVEETASELCMLCGAYLVDGPDHPVFSQLPPLILLPANERDASIDMLIELLDQELRVRAPGARTVASRYVDAILVIILRHWIATDAFATPNWLRGLRDPVLSRVLSLIQHQYAQGWTLETLARAGGASRATLARNFTAAVGTTPMRYLARRRLAVARRLHEASTMTLEQIAAQVGYGSAFSLSKAFKREFGAAPAHLRSAGGHSGQR